MFIIVVVLYDFFFTIVVVVLASPVFRKVHCSLNLFSDTTPHRDVLSQENIHIRPISEVKGVEGKQISGSGSGSEDP